MKNVHCFLTNAKKWPFRPAETGNDKTQQLRLETSGLKRKQTWYFHYFLTLTSTSLKKSRGLTPGHHLLLFGELFFPDVRAPQLNVEHALHCAQNFLVGSGGALLKVLDNGGGGVALGREFLLCHLVGFLIAALLDGVCDLVADGLGLDDVIAAVNLCQVLAFATA